LVQKSRVDTVSVGPAARYFVQCAACYLTLAFENKLQKMHFKQNMTTATGAMYFRQLTLILPAKL